MPMEPKKKKKIHEGRTDDTVFYDFYAEMKEKTIRPMYNPNDSMVILDEETKFID